MVEEVGHAGNEAELVLEEFAYLGAVVAAYRYLFVTAYKLDALAGIVLNLGHRHEVAAVNTDEFLLGKHLFYLLQADLGDERRAV